MLRTRRPLDPIELRILGSLLEKQTTTPEYYPLSTNALVAACNQKSNREPFMEISEEEIAAALERLQEMNLVWRILGGRATRWEQNVEKKWEIDAAARALITLLFLRGPQTAGELRGRSERLFEFRTVEEVEAVLRRLRDDADPFVVELARQPGQKERRWMHLFAGDVDAGDFADSIPAGVARPTAGSLESRVATLETRIEELSSELSRLRNLLGDS
jgi:uncharacterized protein